MRGSSSCWTFVSALSLLGACATTTPVDPVRVVGVDYELRSHPLGLERTVAPAPATPTTPAPTSPTAWRPGTFMAQALDAVLKGALGLQEKHTHLGFYDQGACVLGAFMGANASNEINFTVTPGEEYVVMAAGDQDVKDLNLRVDTTAGVLVKEDVDDDPLPLVRFVATESRLRARLSMVKLEGRGSFVSMVLLKAQGVRLARERVVHAVDLSLAVGGVASGTVPSHISGAKGLVFHAAGDWGFYAAVLQPGTSWRSSGVALGGPAVILGGGDGVARELAIVVRSGETVVATAADKDDRPVAVLTAPPSNPVNLTLTNTKSPQVSLATLLVLVTE